ncbi:MAG: hypothetical protein FJ042_08675 [Candidatus Cloacimonetes bacterium]|nr:hypothetical protein [Candidatus Cloacimonadota bacterium]
MIENQNFDTILELDLSGELAHFRYTIPPRTAICGLVASILMLPRDSYYQTLSSNNLGIGICVPTKSVFRKQFFTLNYVGNEKVISDVSEHKQCRLELLMPAPGQRLHWTVYLGYKLCVDPILDSLEERIKSQNLGFDVYLGQRQLRAEIDLLRKYGKEEFSRIDCSDYLDSVISRDRIVSLDTESFYISIERMPLEQELETKGKSAYRRSVRFADVVIETSGKRLAGQFNDLVELNNEARSRISFL